VSSVRELEPTTLRCRPVCVELLTHLTTAAANDPVPDTSLGDITLHDYVQTDWLPHKHPQASTRAAYVSYLNKQFHPFFGHRRLNWITPSPVQDWVTQAHTAGLSPRSIRTYHVMLSAIFARAVKDQILVHNPLRPHRASEGHHPPVPHPHSRRVRAPPRSRPGPASVHGRDPHRDRTALGRTRRPQNPGVHSCELNRQPDRNRAVGPVRRRDPGPDPHPSAASRKPRLPAVESAAWA